MFISENEVLVDLNNLRKIANHNDISLSRIDEDKNPTIEIKFNSDEGSLEMTLEEFSITLKKILSSYEHLLKKDMKKDKIKDQSLNIKNLVFDIRKEKNQYQKQISILNHELYLAKQKIKELESLNNGIQKFKDIEKNFFMEKARIRKEAEAFIKESEDAFQDLFVDSKALKESEISRKLIESLDKIEQEADLKELKIK